MYSSIEDDNRINARLKVINYLCAYHSMSSPYCILNNWFHIFFLGNKISVSFRSFDLEESVSCNEDYVEIRKDDAVGEIIGVYCGNDIPGNITTANKLWIKFRSDAEEIANGFIADYSLGKVNIYCFE